MRQPLQTAARIDLPRYMGDWFVIANIPYFAEKNCFDSTESYALRADGRIDNWFTCRKGSFDAPLERQASAIATVTDTASNAAWTVRFFKIVPVSLRVLAVDPDYRWALVGHPSRRYGWIFSRTKILDDAVYQKLLRDLAGQGYDPTQFQKVPQRPGATG